MVNPGKRRVSMASWKSGSCPRFGSFQRIGSNTTDSFTPRRHHVVHDVALYMPRIKLIFNYLFTLLKFLVFQFDDIFSSLKQTIVKPKCNMNLP